MRKLRQPMGRELFQEPAHSIAKKDEKLLRITHLTCVKSRSSPLQTESGFSLFKECEKGNGSDRRIRTRFL